MKKVKGGDNCGVCICSGDSDSSGCIRMVVKGCWWLWYWQLRDGGDVVMEVEGVGSGVGDKGVVRVEVAVQVGLVVVILITYKLR